MLKTKVELRTPAMIFVRVELSCPTGPVELLPLIPESPFDAIPAGSGITATPNGIPTDMIASPSCSGGHGDLPDEPSTMWAHSHLGSRAWA